jgi:DnaJ-class molecular chaperone
LFKSVHAAYRVLADPLKRDAYDKARALDDGESANASVPGGGLDSSAFAALFDLSSEPHSDSAGAAAARDLALQVKLSFRQALLGGVTSVRLPTGDTIRLPVPRGTRHGLKIRVPSGAVGTAGDLYVTFRVEPDARFRREGDDLHVVECISALEAMLGTTRALANAYGRIVRLPIPPGTQPGDRLRLKGQGVETATDRGDLYVEVQVEVPRELSDEQRAMLARAARRCGLL